jgi:hypothetical protein
MDWNPDPHNLLIPNACLSCGIPEWSSTCLGKKAPSEDEFYIICKTININLFLD